MSDININKSLWKFIQTVCCRPVSAAFFWVFISALAYCDEVSQQEFYLWSKNLEFDVYNEVIHNALAKAQPKFGTIVLKPSHESSYKAAFERLRNNNPGFDAMISASHFEREEGLLPVYIPLDRGLLGVRVCLINQASQPYFSEVKNSTDFSRLSLQVVLDESWPDKGIMEANQIPVKSINSHDQRIQFVMENAKVCYSRSIFEIGREHAANPDLVIEKELLLVYHQADILYFRKGAKNLAEAIQYGLIKSYEDGTFQQIYNRHFQSLKEKNNLYGRKIFFLQSPMLSAEALEAINRYGIFSFINRPSR